MVRKETEPPALQPLVSLATALRLAYRTATKRDHADEATLDRVARIVAAHVKLFVCAPGCAYANPALVMPGEIEEGYFKGGGAALAFRDDRPSLTNAAKANADR